MKKLVLKSNKKLNFSNLTIRPFILKKDLQSVATLFALTFSEPPWNEYTKCRNCKELFGKRTHPGDQCSHCGIGILQLAYSQFEAENFVKQEMEKSNIYAIIVETKGEIVAFTWGYSEPSIQAFVNGKHYNRNADKQVEDVLVKNNIKGKVFYFSEIVIAKRFRGYGLGTKLTSLILNKAKELYLPVIMHSSYKSPMILIAKKFGMQIIMGYNSYLNPKSNRIAKGEVINCIDKERQGRVLYLLKI